MKKMFFMLALVAGAMAFTACSNEPSDNGLKYYFNKVASSVGTPYAQVVAGLEKEGFTYQQVPDVQPVSYGYLKTDGNTRVVYLSDTTDEGVVYFGSIVLGALSTSSSVYNDDQFIDMLSIGEKYLLPSKDTASFSSFGADGYGSGNDYYEMLGDYRQAMKDAQNTEAEWKKYGESFDLKDMAYPNHIKITRRFGVASRSTGGSIGIIIQNKALIVD